MPTTISTIPPSCAEPRDEALRLLQTFAERILPGAMRRIAAWRNLPPAEVRDLCHEAHHELAIDCLQDPATIVALPPRQRHARWLRLAERWIYRQRWRRGRDDVALDEFAAPPAVTASPALPLAALAEVALRNGRWNVSASAAHSGCSPRWLRQQVDRVAERLGFGEDYRCFWRRRLGEAFTGLAADLLRAGGGLLLLPTTRPAVDVAARVRRIRRLAPRFVVRRSTLPERRMLRPWTKRARFDATTPRRLLEQAGELHPEAGAVWLWLVEACLAEHDLRGAAAALWRSRTSTARGTTAVVLARARLLEARDRWPAAVALLRRACRRVPQAGTWANALRSALAATDHASSAGAAAAGASSAGTASAGAASARAACKASASRFSASASPRGDVQCGNPALGCASQRTSTTTISSPRSRNTVARRSSGGSSAP